MVYRCWARTRAAQASLGFLKVSAPAKASTSEAGRISRECTNKTWTSERNILDNAPPPLWTQARGKRALEIPECARGIRNSTEGVKHRDGKQTAWRSAKEHAPPSVETTMASASAEGVIRFTRIANPPPQRYIKLSARAPARTGRGGKEKNSGRKYISDSILPDLEAPAGKSEKPRRKLSPRSKHFIPGSGRMPRYLEDGELASKEAPTDRRAREPGWEEATLLAGPRQRPLEPGNMLGIKAGR